MKRYLISIIVILVILTGFGYYAYKWGDDLLNEKVEYDTPLIVNITKNTSVPGAIERINRKGYLKPGWFFKYVAKIYANYHDKFIFVGYYKFETGISKYEMVKSLFDPNNLYRESVTFNEGVSYERIATLLNEKLYIDKNEFLRLCKSDSLLNARGIPANNIQGYLLPDTYKFFVKSKASKVLDKLLDHQERIWNEQFKVPAGSLGMTKHEVFTLASIIEAETTVPSERKIVSGLYHNRIEKDWLLQADPTVQYAVGKKKRLLRSDLKRPHPYNTYLNQGLPPGPINCPGIASIEAAVNPADHNYMFMVAVGDGSGRHNFAKTHTQHMRYVREFRRNYRNDD